MNSRGIRVFVGLLSAAGSIFAQGAGTGGIAGTVLDAKTLKPVPAALVIAVRNGAPRATKNTKSGGDGAFQLQGLAAGQYSLCVQATGDGYIDPCQWGQSPTTVTLFSGQPAANVSLKLTPASVVSVLVQDPQKIRGQKTKDGRQPELTVGIWGPKGLYYPAHVTGSSSATGAQSGVSYTYRVGVPRDTPLKLHVSSRDLRLGDASGAALPGNASQQAFQHATGDAKPKGFAFTVLGRLP